MIAAQADPDVFRREVFGEFDLLYTVAALTAGSRHEAKSILPSVMTLAYRGWPEAARGLAPRVWLLKILSEEMRNGRGRPAEVDAAEERNVEPDDAGGAPVTAGAGLSPAVVRRAIRDLPRRHREVLALSEIAGLTYREIGAVLGVARSVARERLHDARDALKVRLFGASMPRR